MINTIINKEFLPLIPSIDGINQNNPTSRQSARESKSATQERTNRAAAERVAQERANREAAERAVQERANRAYIFYAEDYIKGKLNIAQLVDYINKFKRVVNLTNEDILQMLPMYYYRVLLSTFGYEQYALNPNCNTSQFYLELGNELYGQMCFVEKYLSALESIVKLVGC